LKNLGEVHGFNFLISWDWDIFAEPTTPQLNWIC
jgi:hypothetical protein